MRLREKRAQGENVDLSSILFHHSWPSMHHGGLNQLKAVVESLGDVKLVVIDTLAYFQGYEAKAGYNGQYQVIAEMSRIANELGVAMIALHHTIKAKPAKWKQSFYGSNGVTGGADTIFLLDKDENSTEAILRAAGRDIEERAIRLVMDGAVWKQGDEEISEDMVLLGKEGQTAVYYVLREAGRPLTLAEIAENTRKSKPNICNMLKELVAQGLVTKHAGGNKPTYSVDQAATETEQ
jgi:DNA-binding HxlR family transcriptional regulator